MDIELNIRAILEKCAANGEPIPSLRALRALVGGKGSLTTISDIVKAWRLSQIPEPSVKLPEGFDLAAGESIVSAIWKTVTPILRSQIENARADIEARIKVIQEEAEKLRSAALETLAEAQEKEDRVRAAEQETTELRKRLATAEAELQQTRQRAADTEARLEELREKHLAIIKDLATAEATLKLMEQAKDKTDTQEHEQSTTAADGEKAPKTKKKASAKEQS